MSDGAATLDLTLHRSIHEIGAAAWDGCAGSADPFVSFAFLSALEDSGSASAQTGWLPQHLCLRDAAGTVVAVVPAYAKAHSWGEYVFDHGWADALERAGGHYYPKLQAAVPFTPVPGPRLLVRPGSAVPYAALARALVQACAALDLSSVHVTFCEEAEWKALGAAGWLRRLGRQFHWTNAGYGDFGDFLAALRAPHRKTIRRERREAAEGLTLRALQGAAITPAHWDAFYVFYRATTDRKWGDAYLRRRFFHLLGERLGERCVLMLAEQDGRPVAGALNLIGADTLYGRNWGATIDRPFLHFELCYYQAIAFAIRHGLRRVEAGAQGEHKLARGYLPAPTWSAHWIAHPGLRDAVDAFLVRERREVRVEMAELARLSPFHREGAGGLFEKACGAPLRTPRKGPGAP